MNSRSVKFLVAVILFGMSHVGAAQVLHYMGCELEKTSEFAEMINDVYASLDGGERPTVSLMINFLNGPNDQTHTVLTEHDDYESFDAWGGALQTPEAALIIERAEDLAVCENEGLLIERASWGDRDAEWRNNAVFPVTTSDAEAYAAALDELFTSETGANAPGATILYESRAGSTITHVVVALAPSFAALNDYLDTFFQSDDYEDFVDDVAEIRTVGVRTQSIRYRTWEP